MIASMTGFGRAVTEQGGKSIQVEVRSVNNRFLDTVIKMPRQISGYEQSVRDIIGKRLQRGRVSVWINILRDDSGAATLSLNHVLAKEFVASARELSRELDLDDNIDINAVLNLPEVVTAPVPVTTDEDLWSVSKSCLQKALDQMVHMREEEGASLKNDLESRIQTLLHQIDMVETDSDGAAEQVLSKLRDRVHKLMDTENLDEGRLEMELALLVDRMDITEECVRFRSHCDQFLDSLQAVESQGRKLNFILQEMHREINTIGSKTNLAEVSREIVDLKNEIERIREQVQNIE